MGYCGWNSASEIDRHYHDTEWGIPVHNDQKQFEYLMMEVMQCGLSWELMLRKREIFRQCFDNFDFDKVAAYDDRDLERIMNTDGMIRSPRKIRAIINNARCFQKIRNLYGSFSNYLWAYSDGKTIIYSSHGGGRIPVSNGLSARISKDLKSKGFKYLGAVTVYSSQYVALSIGSFQLPVASLSGRLFCKPKNKELHYEKNIKFFYFYCIA